MSSESNSTEYHSIPSKIDKALGARLRTLRIDAGITQHKLAGRLGITSFEIESHERGLIRINAWRLFELSRGLGVPLSKFSTGTRTSKPTAWDCVATVDQRRWQTMQLMLNFQLIEDRAMRNAIFDFVRNVALTVDDTDDNISGDQPPAQSGFVRLAALSQRCSDECKPAPL